MSLGETSDGTSVENPVLGDVQGNLNEIHGNSWYVLVGIVMKSQSHMLRTTSYSIPQATKYIVFNPTCYELHRNTTRYETRGGWLEARGARYSCLLRWFWMNQRASKYHESRPTDSISLLQFTIAIHGNSGAFPRFLK